MRLNVIMFKDALKGLMDSSISEQLSQQIKSIAILVPGVKRITKIVGRRVGAGVWIELVIRVEHSLSYEKGYMIAKQVEASLKNRIDSITGVNITIEPYMP
ncbi:magnetosome protein MamM-1 [Candidatus Magnetoovum chiemensis]|nr:magnetosome protein MamM-1 [Candidatus Magnetoovum chiemensis]